ncbi:hypothetical protein Klosneuvirus_2_146 [Klosneuvirus KNV1]|uniref:Uncharacterized protein n=1 Tax=Klosneuvirus KNV1 TaxID=1977640 RepID=A0A1V0SJ21_9VIRU|nr:hypothetical protein Klosneuvirus_2_146 [Klosneuvirus KNV1]
MKIINNNHEITINFDPYGNLYFEHAQKTYQIIISGNGLPVLDQGSYTIIQPYVKEFKKIIPIDKKNPLQQKLKKKLENQENNENDNSDDEYFLDEQNDDCYPEDKDHIIEEDIEEDDNTSIDGDTIEKYGEYNYKFDFWNIEHIDINYREDGDITALYDIYIYDDNNLIFKSHSIDDSSIYRFRIYKNGDIFFRPIGGTERKCKLECINQELILFVTN